MLLLERTKPHQLRYIRALVRRMHHTDEELLHYHARLSNLEAGFYGEQRSDREFADFTIPHKHYLLHNLELLNPQGFSHQMDTVVFTLHFLLIIEIKNITGQLFYKPGHHEFGRKRQDGTKENFSDPFEQAYRHKLLLEDILHSWNINLPVEYAVVMTNQNAMIDASLQGLPIFHLSGLRRFLHQLFIKYPEARLIESVFEKTSEQLLRAIQRTTPKRLVALDRLKKGVLCPSCEFQAAMHYTAGNWQCKVCHTRDKKALLQALDDYRLLVSERITNQEFREFTGIDSIQVASKILSRLGFEKVGDKRGRFYIIPEDCIKDK
jgi:ribosomal protein L37AE/L43A